MKTHGFGNGTLNWKSVFVTLIFLTGLISDTFGQYQKLYKGQPNPFDTAVAVRIDRYRLEGKALKLGKELVDSLTQEVHKLTQEVETDSAINVLNQNTILVLTASVQRKDSVNQVLSQSFDRMAKIAERQNKWYRRPETYVIGYVAFKIVNALLTRL